MLPGVVIEIDQLGGDFDRVESRLFDRFRFADEGQNGTIVIGIRMLIEKRHALNRGNGRSDLGDDLWPPRFAEIGYTFDDFGHGD